MKADINLHELLMRQISAIVDATAEIIAAAESSDVLLETARLYRFVEINCKEKAQVSEGFAKTSKDAEAADFAWEDPREPEPR